ncbi:23S rRNA (guanosine(2251)-2'-O)-methyltransferase RlmB [Ferroacidibacillus organovorans]|nr:23S rRNA (guanosine(2251)-2'-O)-methyltransferase RlmB [Ferroacidibacillus organovorans]
MRNQGSGRAQGFKSRSERSGRPGRSESGFRKGGDSRGSEDARRRSNSRGMPSRDPIREREGADIEAQEMEMIIGRRAVIEAIKGQRTLNKLLIQEGASGGSIGEIMALSRANGIVTQMVPKAKLDELAQNKSHQGVAAYLSAKDYVELEALIAHARAHGPGLIVLLDGLEDPHNLGSILRSAEAAGAHGVIIPKRRAVPLTGTVAKASAGALEHVQVARVGNVSQAIETLQKAGFWVYGADAEGEQAHDRVDLTEDVVLVIGNEGAGLAPLVKKRCDHLIRIPMTGKIQSLNAGVATGILLFEAVRQRRNLKSPI